MVPVHVHALRPLRLTLLQHSVTQPQMGEIQGQALVMDLNNDGEVEIFAGRRLRASLSLGTLILSCLHVVSPGFSTAGPNAHQPGDTHSPPAQLEHAEASCVCMLCSVSTAPPHTHGRNPHSPLHFAAMRSRHARQPGRLQQHGRGEVVAPRQVAGGQRSHCRRHQQRRRAGGGLHGFTCVGQVGRYAG